MSYDSTLATNHALSQRLYDHLRQLGVKKIDYDRINLYASREAQSDSKPALSWEEAAAAAQAYAERRPLTRLPGPDRDMTFTLEDGLEMGGIYFTAAQWERILKEKGDLFGVEVDVKLVPGTEKKASWWQRVLGETDRGTYTIELKGPKAQIERLMDVYHDTLYSRDRTSE